MATEKLIVKNFGPIVNAELDFEEGHCADW